MRLAVQPETVYKSLFCNNDSPHGICRWKIVQDWQGLEAVVNPRRLRHSLCIFKTGKKDSVRGGDDENCDYHLGKPGLPCV